MKGNFNFKRFLITWLVLFLAVDFAMGAFGLKKEDPSTLPVNTVSLETTKDKFAQGKEVIVKVTNYKDESVVINVPNCEPALNVYKYETGVWQEKTVTGEGDCQSIQQDPITLPSGESTNYTFNRWNHELFSEIGAYRITLDLDQEYTSKEFTIKKRGIFKRTWDFLFHKPLYNLLIFLTDITPDHSLGLAIIMLTIVIKLLLLIPSTKGLRAQKRMQEIQPRIKEIQEKYKGNQERIAMETMALWKEAKVNPLGSCLPLLIQFPVLIALYFSVRDVAFGGNEFALYEFQKNFDFESINTLFLGVLELAERNKIVLPIIVGMLQFTQMKLTFALRKPKNETKKTTPKNPNMPDMESMNKTMTYMMPLMIAFFTASLPAGVGLYWGTSTLFGIGQTLVINREKKESGDDISAKNSSGVTVKVVEKTDEEIKKEEKAKYLPKKSKKKKKKK